MSIWREILRGVLPGQYSERAMRERREARKRALGCICPSYASNRGECPVHDARGRVRPGYFNDDWTCTCGEGVVPSAPRSFVYWHGFHSREGFYFDSDDEGNVTIFITETAHHAAPVLRAITLPENEWASVVASVCRRGETAESWQAARDFHNASEDSNQEREPS